MLAVTAEKMLVLPRVSIRDPARTTDRRAKRVVWAHRHIEEAGAEVWRPYPGEVSLADADRFLLLNELGPLVNGPAEAAGRLGTIPGRPDGAAQVLTTTR
jgi:hypothetical protein